MEYFATGVMSGTSLDGIDMAWCRFQYDQAKWSYEILKAETIKYPAGWEHRLANAHQLPADELLSMHARYGHYIGQMLHAFFERNHIHEPGIIACHGHTVFHQPDAGYTFQLGHGAAIAAEVTAKVICDFRSLDVALKGQGAPLVPIGDHFLFPQYDYCLNLGGFANISTVEGSSRIAFDICPVNFVINKMVQQEHNRPGSRISGHPGGTALGYDRDGELAKKGEIHPRLLADLNALAYYRTEGPKSLGAEWVDENIWPLIDQCDADFHDKLRTYYTHVAMQVNACLHKGRKGPGRQKKVFMTGGGTHNLFLRSLIIAEAPEGIVFEIPDRPTIEYKEALVFALLGILWTRNEANCLASATGSIRNNIGGCMYLGQAK